MLCVHVFILTFAHASVFMTEDNEMQDAFSMVFFLRIQYMALSLYFRRHLYKLFYLHDWRLEKCVRVRKEHAVYLILRTKSV